MKRILSLIASVIIGGMILWANHPVGSSLGKIQQKQDIHHLNVCTPLDNPDLMHYPLLKQRMESSYNNGEYYMVGNPTRSSFFSRKDSFTPLRSETNQLNPYKRKNVTAQDNLYGVDCEVVYDHDVYNPSHIYFYNQYGENEFFFDYDEQTWEPLSNLTAELPEGEYTAFAIFWVRYNKDGNKVKDGLCAYVFKENVTVPCKDKLIFDASDATNQIKFNVILPDGKVPTLPLIDYDTNEVKVPGTISSLCSQTWIIDKELEIPVAEMFVSANQTDKPLTEIREYDLYVNDLSDRFCATYVCAMKTSQTSIVACEDIGCLRGGIVETTNDPDSYKIITTDIAHTPLYDQIGLAKNGYLLNITPHG